ncbi:cytochrome b [Rhodoferax sp. U11-2br]|uniref:cytochrome b n=1 Tax=Rhodoferax sp. U11-2br TaxID=2838878 RepID=UPI001BEBBDEE|nr:cytochrome b [Rhodoferax sp. U11-2br]MBT3068625.1 cytochrome b [Rhodoferax sp. U11-2br]
MTRSSSSSAGLIGQPRYSPVAIVLHWLLALVILSLFGMGLYMADLPFSPTRMKLYNWHKWAGVCFLLLTVLRVVWRVTHRPPALPQTVTLAMPGWQMQAYHATHHLMYALFLAVPLLGWAYSSAAGYPIVLFGVLPLPDFVGADKALAELIKPLHGLSAWALIALAALHIGAALKHHWLDRDGLMLRMLPGRG